MTTQQHTPGPWRVLGLNGGYEPTIASAGDVFIACTQHPASEDEDLANAVLIAAAPDLLAELEHAAEVMAEHASVLERSGGGYFLRSAEARIRAVVAKAKGQ